MNKINAFDEIYYEKTEEYEPGTYGFEWFDDSDRMAFSDPRIDKQCPIPFNKTLIELKNELGLVKDDTERIGFSIHKAIESGYVKKMRKS